MAKALRILLLLVAAALPALWVQAHPMPNSVLLIDVRPEHLDAELQWPLKELQLAFPEASIDTDVQTLLQRKGAWLDSYLKQHLRITDQHGRPWTWNISRKQVKNDHQEATGDFHELVFHLQMQPPKGSSPRHFTLQYDAIMHQVVTHKLLAFIRQDWDGGLSSADSMDADLGVLMMNLAENKAPVLIVNLDEGSRWKGFRNMVSLGMAHIAGGTDHLLFLLVLLLPAPLLLSGSRWGANGGMRYSMARLLKIVTAFTIGHSITLIAGAIGWVHLPSRPVEALIAVSILVGAMHALRPVFPGKEALVAAGFGLVHGLAFAATLANLNLDTGRMTISILGFNIGIELMQLFVIVLVVPWLMILSSYSSYRWIRMAGAVLTMIAALGWLLERIGSKPNIIAQKIESLLPYSHYMVLFLAVTSLFCYVFVKKAAPGQG